MANAHELTAGVHGYSGPCEELVVFEVNKAFSRPETAIEANCGVAPILARGCWQGKENPAFILPLPAFHELCRRAALMLAGEDCVLVLGRPGARNWRPARLEWLRGDKAGMVEHIGTWHSVTEVEAMARDGWTFVPSLSAWFVVSENPAPSVSARDLARVPIEPVPDFPSSGGPAMPHDYSREPGGAALHKGAADHAARVARMCEAQGDMSSALWWQRRAAVHLAYALKGAEAGDYALRQRATMWELIAKASACTIGRRDLIRPALDQEAITWAEAETALALILDARKAGGAA